MTALFTDASRVHDHGALLLNKTRELLSINIWNVGKVCLSFLLRVWEPPSSRSPQTAADRFAVAPVKEPARSLIGFIYIAPWQGSRSRAARGVREARISISHAPRVDIAFLSRAAPWQLNYTSSWLVRDLLMRGFVCMNVEILRITRWDKLHVCERRMETEWIIQHIITSLILFLCVCLRGVIL